MNVSSIETMHQHSCEHSPDDYALSSTWVTEEIKNVSEKFIKL